MVWGMSSHSCFAKRDTSTVRSLQRQEHLEPLIFFEAQQEIKFPFDPPSPGFAMNDPLKKQESLKISQQKPSKKISPFCWLI